MIFRANVYQANIMERMVQKHLSQEIIQEILDMTQTKEEITQVKEYLKQSGELTDQVALKEIKLLLHKNNKES